MNYLELCQKLMRRAGISGTIASVVNQSGELLRVVDWVAEGYRAILNLHGDWEFLRADVTFLADTVNTIYTPAAASVAEFGEWRVVDSDWRAYNKAIGVADEQPLVYVDYDKFRRVYQYGTQRTMTGRPQVFTIRPDQSLQIWPMPDAEYYIVGEQYRYPADFATNGDAPIFKAKFHDAVFYRALMLYAEYEEAGTVHAAAQAECLRIVGTMEDAYLPELEASGPMA
jgi:hypothetical protein